MDEPTPEEKAESEEFVGKIPDGESINTILLNMEKIRLAQEEDPLLHEVRKWVKGNPPTKQELRGKPEEFHSYRQNLESLYLDEGGMLMMRHRQGQAVTEQKDRIVIPRRDDILQQVMYWSHAHPSAGHFGINATTCGPCHVSTGLV